MVARGLLAFVLALPGAAFGQPTALQLDPAQTRVDLTLSATLHTVHGTFRLKRGTIRFDPSTGKISGEIVLDAASGDTGNSSRDSRMHASILESQRYPEIAFRPDRFDGKIPARGAFEARLHGTIAIHGAEHEVTLPLGGEVSEERLNATTRLQIPYVKWGMKNPSTLLLRVSDKVEIEIHASGRLEK